MRIAFLTTDNREHLKRYDKVDPVFGPAPSAVLEGLALFPKEIEVHVISCTRQVMNTPTKLAENIWFHQPLVPKTGWGRTFFLGCAWAVRNVLRDIKPDLVHGQGTEKDCSISAVFSGYPNVLTIHGIMQAVARAKSAPLFSYYGMVSVLERIAVKMSGGVICNTTYTQGWIAPGARTTWKVPNCIRSAFLLPPKTRKREKVIVVIGTVIEYKQSVEILKMWSGMKDRTEGFQLVFIGGCGNTEYCQEFKRLVSDPAMEGHASHLGWMESDEIVEFLNLASGMIHFPTEESFGLVVAEGLSRNLKLFAANTGGIPDVVEGCEGVELFAHNDWINLSNRILIWISLGAPIPSTFAVISKRFSPAEVARQHLKIYKELVNAAR